MSNTDNGIYVHVPLSKLKEIADLLETGVRPMVTFRENAKEMDREAYSVRGDVIKKAKDKINLYIYGVSEEE